ncbi:MAG: penicillin-binding protein [Candidatus Magasanikbacteria bacterium]
MSKKDRRSYGFDNKKENKKTKKKYTKKKKNTSVLGKVFTVSYKIGAWIFKFLWSIIKAVFSGIFYIFSFIFKINFIKSSKFKKIIGWGALTIFVFGFLSITIITAWASKNLPSPDQLIQRDIAQTTKIYDRSGEHLLYEIFANKNRTLVELNKVPKHLKQGVIATEDDRFYEHYGVRPLSIARAVFNAIVYNERIQGTSTLTQQLVKNAVLTRERSYIRKIKEMILSLKLEQQYSKKQILKMYFNEIPYGSTNYGVASAAEDYFNKEVSDLNLNESAILAGLPKAPSSFLANPKELKQRRNFVLYRMYKEGYISKEKMENTQKKPLSLSRDFQNIKAPHFVLHVREKLIDKFGERKVDTGGLKVITSLDWDMQKKAKKVVSSTGSKVLNKAEADNTGLVAMDPKSSQILSMIGSKNFYNEKIDGKFNIITEAKRQPGSSFKPIVYTAAFQKGYTPSTILYDVKTDFAVPESKEYIPKNYDLKERGPVTMRKALQGSINIPAVKTLYLTGTDKALEFSKDLGYTTLSKRNLGLSLVLGGGGVIPLEHANAYATLANGGIQREPTSILKVEGPNGEILYEQKKKEGERIIDAKYTKLITDVLSDNEARAFAFGTDSVLQLEERPVAAKTGTTNDYVDSWTMGYTPNLVAGVWAGNTDNSPMKRGFGGSKVAGPIWNEFMKKALEDKPIKKFPDPPNLDVDKPILKGEKGKIKMKINEETGLIATSSTPDHLIETKTFVPPHSILHYVDKDNPRGPRPENPSKDPQYEIWEKAIKDWKKRMKKKKPDWNLTFKKPPTKKDKGYSPELAPTVNVVYPKPSSTITTREINTDIRFSAPRGVDKVIYRIDGRYVGVEDKHPFNLNYKAKTLEDGKHTLTIIAQDDIGNRKIKKINFILKAGKVKSSVSFIRFNKTITKRDYPLSIFFRTYKEKEIDSITIQATKNDKSITLEKIKDKTRFKKERNKVIWNNYPEENKGQWTIKAKIRSNNNEYIGGSMKMKVK